MPANPARTLLSPDNHSLLMIDHQYLQMLTIRSHDASELINHAVALVEAAAIFKVPMLTTTAFKERQGLVAPLAEATRAVTPIDRTTLNSWEDPRIVDWVEKTGRKKLVIAGQWTEVCVAMPVLSLLPSPLAHGQPGIRGVCRIDGIAALEFGHIAGDVLPVETAKAAIQCRADFSNTIGAGAFTTPSGVSAAPSACRDLPSVFDGYFPEADFEGVIIGPGFRAA